ncbi:catalase [Mumia flava]|uniref:Catalase n=1 Tax=Mumia flava TaxID=1348852 RepID=A0A2M9BDW7_9ACTN|nr:catalase [Mumia flava]PJJ56139.1 catalase [Mumia flava]
MQPDDATSRRSTDDIGTPPPAPPSPTGAEPGGRDTLQQQGERLTTAHGTPLPDTDHSLKVGPRGPTLLQDHHLREKITHFDHERIPERVVHARGAAAHGVFTGYGAASDFTRATFLEKDRETPVFVRFSTVLGSRGSADTVRDTRGFATKFYTDEGTFDLVGNNIPVFFIQDGIKFPDIIHAAKPHPDREIPQAQSAHDTFWDFVSLHTEAQHHTIWNMSDRGIPRSYRMMEGFGVHTFRTRTAEGHTSLVKFHWKPTLGVHSLTWEEAQLLGGIDPDFHRRDLADAIDAGAFPSWELGIQVFRDTPDQSFEDIDLLDPTKLVPEELAPIQPIGRMVLTANPTNYFAETEQVAFHVGHLPPGIDATDDPLMQTRLFSYVDTQLTRLGGPNFSQLPINRPRTPVNDMLRDGFGQQAVHSGVAPYRPNSLDGGCPVQVPPADGGREDIPVTVEAGPKIRAVPTSFSDHFTQPRQFWLSMSAVEQQHIVAAYSFELLKCSDRTVQERQVACLARIDPSLCAQVADALGMPVPDPDDPLAEPDPSPALSQLGDRWPVDGRRVGVVVDGDDEEAQSVVAALSSAQATPLVIAAHGGRVGRLPVAHAFSSVRSVELDALIVLGRPAPAADADPVGDAKAGVGSRDEDAIDPRVLLLVQECYRHAKPLAALGAGIDVLDATGCEGPGVARADSGPDAVAATTDALASHRVWDRFSSSAN